MNLENSALLSPVSPLLVCAHPPLQISFPIMSSHPQQLIKPIHAYLSFPVFVDLVLGPGYPSLVLYFFFIKKNLTYKYLEIPVSVTLLVKNLLIFFPFHFLLEFITTFIVVLQQLLAPFLRTCFILTCN